MKTFSQGEVSVTLKNGRIVKASWILDCRDIHVTSYDTEFFGIESIDSSKYCAEIDAIYCLRKIIEDKGGQLA
ncbi:MAG: hypothetical protein SO238_00100 [Treponema sp.]|nr:hypothetical protein [Spirochaetia bacterium]MDY4766814.1 hypothetical protein [Treponema sp.]